MSHKCLHGQPQMMNTEPTDDTPLFHDYILSTIIWLPGWGMAMKALAK